MIPSDKVTISFISTLSNLLPFLLAPSSVTPRYPSFLTIIEQEELGEWIPHRHLAPQILLKFGPLGMFPSLPLLHMSSSLRSPPSPLFPLPIFNTNVNQGYSELKNNIGQSFQSTRVTVNQSLGNAASPLFRYSLHLPLDLLGTSSHSLTRLSFRLPSW